MNRSAAFLLVAILILSTGIPAGATGTVSEEGKYTLDAVIRYALKNNPKIRIANKDIETETYGIDSAKADRMPRIDWGGGITRYRYETPLSPIVITLPLTSGTEIPEFRRTVMDTGFSFRLPLFRGGRLHRGVMVAEMRKAVAEDMYKMTRQDLIYNLTSIFHKIAQLEKLYLAHDASVKQLESHKQNVELYLKTGTAPRLDLLKTEVELSHAKENRLVVKNNIASTYELLKTLMGVDNMAAPISIIPRDDSPNHQPSQGKGKPNPLYQGEARGELKIEESLSKAFSQRPDFKAISRKLKIGEERVKIARGKRLPDIYAAGQYGGLAGTDTSFKENWYFGVKLSVPVFDGGLIRSEIERERVELEKVKEEERFLKLAITREVRDAHLGIANALERIGVTEKTIERAKESLRVEVLKYDTGAGMSTDVIDARTALLRAEAEYYQAVFDRATATAYLKKATGEEEYGEEAVK